MPLRIYRLLPGQSIDYALVPVSRPPVAGLGVRVLRPDEGPSLELVIQLVDRDSAQPRVLAEGRVPLERGYMAVVRELRRQFDERGVLPGDTQFELVRRDDDARPPVARVGQHGAG